MTTGVALLGNIHTTGQMLLSVLSVAVAAAVLVAVDAGMGRPGAAWEHIGPRNIFDVSPSGPCPPFLPVDE